VNVNCVFNDLSSPSKTLFEVLDEIVGQFLLIITHGIDHGSEELILFTGSNIQISQKLNVDFFVEIVTKVIFNSLSQLMIETFNLNLILVFLRLSFFCC
jgi:hypothetical protein